MLAEQGHCSSTDGITARQLRQLSHSLLARQPAAPSTGIWFPPSRFNDLALPACIIYPYRTVSYTFTYTHTQKQHRSFACRTWYSALVAFASLGHIIPL